MREAVIVSIARTPVGKAKKGGFAQTRIEDLGSTVLNAVIKRANGLKKRGCGGYHYWLCHARRRAGLKCGKNYFPIRWFSGIHSSDDD